MRKQKRIERDWKTKNEQPKDIKEEISTLERFVKGHPTEIDIMLENPAFKFLVDTITQNVVYFTKELVYEKDPDEFRSIQGQIIGHQKTLTLVKKIKNIRNFKSE